MASEPPPGAGSPPPGVSASPPRRGPSFAVRADAPPRRGPAFAVRTDAPPRRGPAFRVGTGPAPAGPPDTPDAAPHSRPEPDRAAGDDGAEVGGAEVGGAEVGGAEVGGAGVGGGAAGRARRRDVVVAAAAALVVLLVLAAFLTRRGGGEPAAAPAASPTPTPTVTVPDIYRKVGPSVAVVRTAKGSLGTGVIVSEDGTVLTANHVVSDRSAVSLVFADGTRSAATVAAADPEHDVATLTPATLPQPIVPATLGGAVEIGGAVVAIGNPLGLTYSVSSGVVSATGRTARTNGGTFSGLIQFDASVNPGSSGGPLLDGDGNVIGIVLSIADPGHDDSFAGIAFAVPIGTALGGGDTGTGPGGPQT